jgi:hypothetical protein
MEMGIKTKNRPDPWGSGLSRRIEIGRVRTAYLPSERETGARAQSERTKRSIRARPFSMLAKLVA